MKYILTIFLIALSLSISGQTTQRNENYFSDISDGEYRLKSLDTTFTSNVIIEPQTSPGDINEQKEYIELSGSSIILFNNNNPIDTKDVAGILNKNSFAKVLAKDYRKIYKDSKSKWNVSFEVWNKISINNKTYFTDIKMHHRAYFVEIPKHHQYLLIYTQSGGYDYYYDNGYPEKFIILVLNQDYDLIFESGILDIFYGGEFWDAELESLDLQFLENGRVKIEINGYNESSYHKGSFVKKKYPFVWTGETLEVLNAR